MGGVEFVELVEGNMIVKDGKLKEPVTLKAAWTQLNQMIKYFSGENPIYDSKGQEILEFYFSSSGKLKVRKKREVVSLPSTLTDYGSAGSQTNKLRDVLGFEPPFTPKPVKMISDFIRWFDTQEDNSILFDFFAGSGASAHSVLNLNRTDGGNRQYITVEMGNYFDTLLKPRIQKIIFSKDWSNGIPTSVSGISHIFKYMYLEQYEDTLNNIEFVLPGTTQKTLFGMDGYFLRYMLDFESRSSPCRLNVKKLDRPFDYTMRIVENGKIHEKVVVDLVETFNYLLGLYVERIKALDCDGHYYRVVYGHKDHYKVVVVWRNMEGLNLARDKNFIERTILGDAEHTKLYVNGQCHVEDALSTEREFKLRMGA